MSNNWRARARVAFGVGVLTLSAIMFTASCGSDPPGAAAGGHNPILSPSGCTTPQKGCACDSPGTTVACGESVHGESNFIYCYEGERSCLDSRTWGDCTNGKVSAKSLHPLTVNASGIGPLALGAPTVCTSPADAGADAGDAAVTSLDPCDPYCNVRSDDPSGLVLDGGFGLTEGGLSVLGGDSGAVLPTSPQFTANGDSPCGGAVNVHTNPCNASPFTSCQQDFRCDTASNTCVWNGGEGYYDNTISPPGIDLTIGAGCTYAGTTDIVPVCNRGNLAVPANTIVGVNITNSPEDACTVVHTSFDCAINVGPAGLGPGRCTSIPGCPVPGNKNAVVNATAGPPNVGRDLTEAPGRCANNASAVKYSGGCSVCQACDTVVKGKVYDPSTGAPALAEVNTLPLAGISVFQPAGALTTLTDGVQCDTCTSLDSPKITGAVTDAAGAFTLNGVTPGTNTRIVVQSGRWRRETFVNVPACVTTDLTASGVGTFRLPRSKTDFPAGGSADIPKIAIVTAVKESLACLVQRLGVDATVGTGEMRGRSASTDTNRIQIWKDNGMDTASPAAKVVDSAANGLFTQPVLDEYAAILFDCQGLAAPSSFASGASTTERQLLQAYADKGGRIFADHWAVWWWLTQNTLSNFPGTSTWETSANVSSTTFPDDAYIQIGTPPQQLFSDWLDQAAGATSPAGTRWMTVPEGRRTSITPTAGQTTEWIRGNNAVWNRPTVPPSPSPGSHNLSYSFETPLGSTCPGGGTGRVIANSMHVSQTRGTTGTFPGSCASGLALGPEEKALAYQFFQLTACALGGAPPPPPPPATPIPVLPASLTYSVDFTSTCAFNEQTVWQLFEWKAVAPPGTSIDFRAISGNNPALFPPANTAPPLLPTTVPIGTANNASAVTDASGWTFDTNSVCTTPPCPAPVSYHLKNDPPAPIPNGSNLRIYMTFKTNAVVSPILFNWRQLFDCVPAE